MQRTEMQKSIKDIRILTTRSPSLVSRRTSRDEVFSFSKKDRRMGKIGSEEQREVQRMIHCMMKKVKQQERQIESVKPQYKKYLQAKEESDRLREQLCEVKDLMRRILLERQGQKMNKFYQDQ